MARRKKKSAKASNDHSTDPVEILLRITCNYPWPRKQLLALHALKYDVSAAAFRFYASVPKGRADDAVKDILRKWVNSLE